MSALHSHIASLSQHPSNWFARTDFKLEPCDWPPDPRIARECNVHALSVRIVKELVTLCPVDLSLTANHVSAEAFHQLMLQGRVGNGGMENGKVENGEMVNGGVENGGVEGEEESTGECEEEQEEKEEGRVPRGMVVLDTRNVYETRIGRFVPPKGAASRFLVMPMCSGLGIDIHPPLHLPVQRSTGMGGHARGKGDTAYMPDPLLSSVTSLAPHNPIPDTTSQECSATRFSDLPAWVDRHEEKLRDKTVLIAVRVLHCTGGVRSTAYLGSKGPGFQDVVQVCAMRCRCVLCGACGAGVCYAVHVVQVCAMRCVLCGACGAGVCYAVHVVQVCAMRCVLCGACGAGVCYAVHVVQVCAMRCVLCGACGAGVCYALSGGIVRYLEAFPDGGFFQGKNFVFDHRLAVPPAAPQQATIGVCCLCVRPFDDYSGRNRCAACRMLLLVCPACTQTETDVLCLVRWHCSCSFTCPFTYFSSSFSTSSNQVRLADRTH
ncbi:unnamed protein product [Closterium sp. NIES-65]|nr:unnamed protein product [Closterium sp. NIES-65]